LPEFKRRILVSKRLFEPTPTLLDALREHRRLRGGDEIAEKYDAFMLDPGLGPPYTFRATAESFGTTTDGASLGLGPTRLRQCWPE
jgi:hypothetical protein